VERHRIDPRLREIVLQLAEPALQRVRLRREREIHRRFGERVVRLRHADEMRRLLRRARDDESLRVGETHVLAGEDDDAARDEHRVLARVDHAHEPVQRGIGIRPANALDERRDRVVVLVTGAVVEKGAALQRVLHLLEPDRSLSVGTWQGSISRELERVQRDARVAVAHRHQPVFRLLRERDGTPEPAFVLQRPLDDDPDVVFRERLQREHAGSREER